MAGSFNHIVGNDGKFTMNGIDNLGDAQEALEECYRLIYYLSDGNIRNISNACNGLRIVDPWKEMNCVDDEKEPMKI